MHRIRKFSKVGRSQFLTDYRSCFFARTDCESLFLVFGSSRFRNWVLGWRGFSLKFWVLYAFDILRFGNTPFKLRSVFVAVEKGEASSKRFGLLSGRLISVAFVSIPSFQHYVFGG
jgi:hypothetical protein